MPLTDREQALLVVLDHCAEVEGYSLEVQDRIAQLLPRLRILTPWAPVGERNVTDFYRTPVNERPDDNVLVIHRFGAPRGQQHVDRYWWVRWSGGWTKALERLVAADVAYDTREEAQLAVDRQLRLAGYSLCPGPLDPPERP